MFAKEDAELTRKVVQRITAHTCISLLVPATVLVGQSVDFTPKLMLIMVDGKICNALSENSASSVSYICGAKPSQMNDLELVKKRNVKEESLSFGISPLHAWIISLECMLHVVNRMDIKCWQVKKDHKERVEQRKKYIQDKLKQQYLGVLVDVPKPGSGTSNDGNTARPFFKKSQNSMAANNLPYYQDVDGYRIPGIFSVEAYRTALKYKPQPDDIFIATFPKCGTTWAQQIVTLILNNGKPVADYVEFSSRSPFIDLTGEEGVDHMKKPGSIKTHLPFNLTPYSPEAKYVYVVRNPKDTIVSFFHHTRSFVYKYENGDFNDYFELFINGENDYGDYFDHVLSWYEHRDDPNVLIVCYEELKKDTPKTIKKIATFLGKKYGELLDSEAVMSDIIKFSSVEYMKTVLNDSLEVMIDNANTSVISKEFIPAGLKHVMEILADLKTSQSKEYELIRKGNVGGWREALTVDQNRRMDEKIQEKLGDTYIYKYWKSINCM